MPTKKLFTHTKNTHIMKPNHLFSSMLVVAALAVSSCSVPQMAQQARNDDDVYGTKAKAVEYTAPARSSQVYDDGYTDGDDYGTSDQYADQDYSSRINRFYYGSPYRNYYDPSYYDGYDSFYGGGYGGYDGLNSGYGYSSVTPYSGYGAPLQTGRSASTGSQPGNTCTTPVRSCELYTTSIVGGGCSCKVGYSRARAK